MQILPRRRPAPRPATSSSPDSVGVRHNAFRAELARVRADYPDDALVAGGEKITRGQASLLRRLVQPWQIRAMGYYDLLGEVKYAAQFYARSLAPLELYAAERKPDGSIERTEEPEVVAALDRIKDPGGGGRSGLLSAYGRLMFLVGEALLFVSRPETKDGSLGPEQWEMLSTDELRALDGSYTRFKAPSLPATNFRPAPDADFVPVEDGEAVAYRLWRKHPRFSELPDSTMAGVLDLCEELVLLTQAVRARARSRLANSGVLFIDERVTTKPVEVVPDEDALEDPFLADLTESMTLPIVDEGTASAVVPLVARVKVPEGMKLADLVYHLQVIDPMQFYPEVQLRMECIRRMAMSLDMPPEVLLGMADVNHWTAWILDETIWKAHIQPVADALVQDLTSAYLIPLLRDNDLVDGDPTRFVIAYDPASVINHPDKSKDAKDLHSKGVIGDRALRREAGFDESDKATEKERATAVGIATRDPSLAWDGIPSVKSGGIEPEPGVVEQGGSPPTGTDVAKGPPPSGPPTAGSAPDGATVAAAHQAAGAAQLALLRVRESVGARVRTAVRRDEAALEAIDGCAAGDVAARLGRAQVRKALNGHEQQALASCRPLVVEALRQLGVGDDRARDELARTVEAHAARTLYDAGPVRLPPTFAEYATGVLAAARQQ